MLRNDLLPLKLLNSTVNTIEEDNIVNDKIAEANFHNNHFNSAHADQSFDDLENDNEDQSDEICLNEEQIMFHVKVIRTMKAQLMDEMDLPKIDEVLAVLSEPDKHYYYGSTFDGKRKGIFPKSFVHVIQSERDSDTPDSELQAPTITPPPLPSCKLSLFYDILIFILIFRLISSCFGSHCHKSRNGSRSGGSSAI